MKGLLWVRKGTAERSVLNSALFWMIKHFINKRKRREEIAVVYIATNGMSNGTCAFKSFIVYARILPSRLPRPPSLPPQDMALQQQPKKYKNNFFRWDNVHTFAHFPLGVVPELGHKREGKSWQQAAKFREVAVQLSTSFFHCRISEMVARIWDGNSTGIPSLRSGKFTLSLSVFQRGIYLTACSTLMTCLPIIPSNFESPSWHSLEI